jgi:hypothetical protein
MIYTAFELDQIAVETENILLEKFKSVGANVQFEIKIRPLPTGLNR